MDIPSNQRSTCIEPPRPSSKARPLCWIVIPFRGERLIPPSATYQHARLPPPCDVRSFALAEEPGHRSFVCSWFSVDLLTCCHASRYYPSQLRAVFRKLSGGSHMRGGKKRFPRSIMAGHVAARLLLLELHHREDIYSRVQLPRRGKQLLLFENHWEHVDAGKPPH